MSPSSRAVCNCNRKLHISRANPYLAPCLHRLCTSSRQSLYAMLSLVLDSLRTHVKETPMVPHASFTFLLVITTLLVLLPGAATAERRMALVMGNAAYEIGPLRNPVNDATDIATTLQQLSFQVTLLRDADLRTMLEGVDAFSRQLRQGGIGLFYFAGHGIQVSGENYLIPVRARINREQDVPYEAVPVGRILGSMEDAANGFNILILDACRDNPFARQWRSSQRGLAVTQAVGGLAHSLCHGTRSGRR